MRKKKSQPATGATEPIKFETVYPIHIRNKDGALCFAPPGEPIGFEDNPQVNIALLAHKLNEVIIQLHRLQRVGFVNNKIIANMLEVKNGVDKAAKDSGSK